MNCDRELAEMTKAKGCPSCGSPLHYSRYTRKGRTEPPNDAPDDWMKFGSLCCSKEGCRKRVRPPSIRFAGRSPFSPTLIILAQLLFSGSRKASLELQKILGISERTLLRWIDFWKRVHTQSCWWRELASLWSLSGQTINTLWQTLIENKSPKIYIEQLLEKTAKLWTEVKFTVGCDPPAKDA